MDTRIVQLCQQGFDKPNANTDDSSRLALKSLANILLLEEETRQNFVDLGYSGKVGDRIKVIYSCIYLHRRKMTSM